MPREINGHSFLTSQEWMQLGYPVFVSAALEESNEHEAEMNQYGNGIITPEQFAELSAEDQLDFALTWNGIIGYTSYILETVRCLDKLGASKE